MIWQSFRILSRIKGAHAMVVSFAGYWSFWPVTFGRLLGIPVYVILHGTDVCRFDAIDYGNLRIRTMRWFNAYTFKHATKLLPVSESLIETKNDYYFAGSNTLHFGVLAEFPKINIQYQVVPNGLDTDFWSAEIPFDKDSKTFVTVASSSQFRRKGIDLIVDVAASLPDAQFIVIGSQVPSGLALPSNVAFLGKLPQKELINHFQTAGFYLQLSAFEGFGLSLCEAMLCECIPIGSDVNFIPEIIGDTGYILKHRDQDELIGVLKKAMTTYDLEMGKRAAQRIKDQFPMEKRQRLLFDIIS